MKRGKDDTDNRVYKILIVDDELDVLNSLNLALKTAKEFKSEITIVTDAETALTHMMKDDYNLVLADYKMPGMNGIELLTQISKRYPKTARILITGYTDVDAALDAINKAKVDNYIEKPCHKDELRDVISQILKRKDLNQ